MMRLQLMIPENTLIRPEIFDRLLSAFGVTGLILFALPLMFGLMSSSCRCRSVPAAWRSPASITSPIGSTCSAAP